MSTTTQRTLQILITHGHEDVEKVKLGLNLALIGASSKVDVTVFFTLRGTHWTCAQQGGSSDVQEIQRLIDALDTAGVSLECCSACLEKYCLDGVGPQGGLRKGVVLAGLASVVLRATEGFETITM